MALDALLLLHGSHGGVRAEQQAHQVDLDDRLDDPQRHGGERPPTTVDARVVDPVVNRAQLLLRELDQLLH